LKRPNKDTIVVVGCAGCGNRGDDLILEGLNNTIGEKYRLIPSCGNIDDIKSFMGKDVRYIPSRFFEGMTFKAIVGMIPFLVHYVYEVNHSVAVIIGGGSLLHGLTGYNLPFYSFITIIAKWLKKPIFIVGVGVGPIKVKFGGVKTLKRILKRVEGIYVREKKDYDLLKNIGYDKGILSADLAFASYMIDNAIIKILKLSPKNYIVVTASQWFQSENFWKRNKLDFSEEQSNLIASIKRIHSLINKPIIFVPTVEYDFKLGLQIEQMINAEWFTVLPNEYNCIEIASFIGDSFMVYGMRMHSLIMATRMGIPFLATVYDQKVSSFLERIGREDCIIPFSKINTEEFDQKIRMITDNYEQISLELLKSSNELKKIIDRDMNSIISKLDNSNQVL